MTDIGLMVRSANPVPDETQGLTNDELSAVFLLSQQRSGEMDTRERTRPVEQDKARRPGWLIAALAFGAIIVVMGAAMLLTRSTTDDVPPATTPPTTQAAPTTSLAPTTTVAPEPVVTSEQAQVIEDYTQASNAADVGAIATLLGPNFGHTDDANPGWVSRTELWSRQQAYWAAEGGTVSYSECVPKGAVVTCLETWSGPIQDVILLRDWTYQTEFDIQDGIIVSMHGFSLVWPDGSVLQDIRERVAAWVRTFDDELGARLTLCGGGAAGENFDIDLASECGQYTVLWAEAGRP